jgi:hypothetical protein
MVLLRRIVADAREWGVIDVQDSCQTLVPSAAVLFRRNALMPKTALYIITVLDFSPYKEHISLTAFALK